MSENYPKPYADLRVKTGEYEKDGKKKNRYMTIGTLFATEHFSNMYLQLETLPINNNWDGRIYVNPREKQENSALLPIKTVMDMEFNDKLPTDDDMNKQIDLSAIPF